MIETTNFFECVYPASIAKIAHGHTCALILDPVCFLFLLSTWAVCLAWSEPHVVGKTQTSQHVSSHTRFVSHPQQTLGNVGAVTDYLYRVNRYCGATLRPGQVGVRSENVNKIVKLSDSVWKEWARPVTASVQLLGQQEFHPSFFPFSV